jgi:hypothetical protein
MKNQYVGDINDYFKYAFLRELGSRTPSTLLVCWMATPDDGGRDGRKRSYLSRPDRYRDIDPGLFDALSRLCESTPTTIDEIQRAELVPEARFFRELLDDRRDGRLRYFQQLESAVPPDSITFFDPDNGLEIKSVPKGRKRSSQYLYLDELAAIGATPKRSLIVYQHFGRVQRDPFIAVQLGRLRTVLPEHELFALAGSHVAFLVAAANGHASALRNAAHSLSEPWPGVRLAEFDGALNQGDAAAN